MTATDPFEEFEFKPITEGLGFQKKTQQTTSQQATSHKTTSLKKTLQQNSLQQNSLQQNHLQQKSPQGMQQQLHPTGPNSHPPEIITPLPRNEDRSSGEYPSKDRPSNRTPTVEDVLATIKQKKFDFSEKLQTPAPVKLSFLPTPIYFTACFLDGMLIASLNLTALVALLMTTRIDFAANIIDPDRDWMLYLALLTLFLGMSFIYLVVTRMFFGFTAGEWVFDQRLGKPEQFEINSFYLKLLLRSFIVIASGMIFFPLLSRLTGRDTLGHWLGLELVRKAT